MNDAQPLLSQLATQTKNLNKDPNSLSAVGVVYKNEMKKYMIYNLVFSTSGPDEWPTSLRTLRSVGKPFMDTTRPMTHLQATIDVDALFPSGNRVMWWSLNIKIDPTLTSDIFEKGMALFAPHLGLSGIEWTVLAQSIPVSLIRESRRNGGDLSGLSEADGDQFLLCGLVYWTDESDDGLVKGIFNEFLSWAKSTATERGKLVPWIYPNYASGTQDVLAGFGQENVEQMKKVQAQYDPNLLLPKYWKGGFHL